jgi:hypothetical protein
MGVALASFIQILLLEMGQSESNQEAVPSRLSLPWSDSRSFSEVFHKTEHPKSQTPRAFS